MDIFGTIWAVLAHASSRGKVDMSTNVPTDDALDGIIAAMPSSQFEFRTLHVRQSHHGRVISQVRQVPPLPSAY